MPVDVKYLLSFPIIAAVYTFLDVAVFTKHDTTSEKSKPDKQINMKETQQTVGICSVSAMLIVLTALIKSNDWFICNSKIADIANGIKYDDYCYSLRWLCLPVLSLIAAIINVANRRFCDQEAITGKRTDRLDVHSRYLQNTLEQTVIFSIIHLIIAFAWSNNDQSNISWIAFNSCLFLSGRILYFRYTIWPNIPGKRALGFALTFATSVFPAIWCLYRLIISL